MDAKSETLRIYAWEVVYGSIDPDIAQRRVNELLDAGARWENEKEAAEAILL